MASNVFVQPRTMPGWLQGFVRINLVSHLVSHLVSAERGWFGRRVAGVGSPLGLLQGGLAEDLISTLEARAMWARYGL